MKAKEINLLFCAVVSLLFFPLAGFGQSQAPTSLWIASWAAAQQIPEPQNALSAEALHDATLRQIVHLSVGGSSLRVHLSNAFGLEPLHITSVHIAHAISPSSSVIQKGSDRVLTFLGTPDVTIPAGADYISDPIALPVEPFSDWVISFYLEDAPSRQTGHPGSRATSYYCHGNHVADEELPEAKGVDHWYQIAAIDVLRSQAGATVVALGDSITDGRGSTTNGNNRWTDQLNRRFQESAATQNLSVVNLGIGGNHLLTDGLGPNVLARFDRDVLAQAGVRFLILLEGVNDLGSLARREGATPAQHDLLIRQMKSAYQQVVLRAHAQGIKALAATILPYVGSEYYHPAASDEADRQNLNQWLRESKIFDGVIDFDKIMRDPKTPEKLLPQYDSGDHLHPSPAGYKAMSDAVSAALFLK